MQGEIPYNMKWKKLETYFTTKRNLMYRTEWHAGIFKKIF